MQPKHGRLPASTAVRSIITVLAVSVAVALVSFTSIAAMAAGSLVGDVQANTVSIGAADDKAQPLVDVGAIDGGVNLLMVGTDARAGQQITEGDDTEGARNDVTMLMHISQDHKNVSVISFPRDTMVDLPSCENPTTGDTVPPADYQQLNTALGRGGDDGGLGCVVAAVEDITGLKIPYAGMISFDGVIAMTNAIGGVDVCIASDINDDFSQAHFKKGMNTLVGQDAYDFLRTREGVGDGSDLSRIGSMQIYLSALVRKILSDGTLTNPVTLYSVAKAALHNMMFSQQLASVDSMVSIAKALQGVSLNNVAFLRYPVVADPDDSNRVVIDDDNAEILNKALIDDTPLDLSQTTTADGQELQQPDGSATNAPTEGDGSDASTDADGSDTSTDSGTPTDGSGDTPTPTPTSTEPGAVLLPDGFTGQTAEQVTCSVGN
jgi:LCP family protein required for cell wall assembly